MTFREDVQTHGLKKALASALDARFRAIMAGISAEELRALLRGDGPTEKPNPRYRAQVKSFLLHIRPKFYQEGSTWFTHTFRLGFFSVFLFLVELITGLVLMVYYAPAPERAYGDMLNLLSNVTFGKFFRDMHRLGAELMVAVVVLHMGRVYFTGAYKKPREFTWLTGAILLLITLFLSFSGYLLPWDQLAYWAVTIGTSMAEAAPLFGNEANLLLRGAQDISAGGLLRFYLLHVFFLPLLAILFISIHYYKVSREHSISLPAPIEEKTAPPEKIKAATRRIDLIPDLLTSELMWAAIGVAVMVVMVAFWFEAPLEHHSNPLKTPLHTVAPWYFWWIQGMLKLGDKTLMGVILPTIMFLLVCLVPYTDDPNFNPFSHTSRLGSRRKFANAMGIVTAIIFVILSYMGTPNYGVSAPPPVEIIQHFIPEEGPGYAASNKKIDGGIRAIPYEELKIGVYDTADPSTWPSGILGRVMEKIDEETRHRLPDDPTAHTTLSIEQWQKDLKRMVMTVYYTDEETGEAKTYALPVYIHRNANYEWEE
ncbi:MAG: cytochrome bc complex cytochrome b subunit [Caldilineae bacterium]|nr:MAG: cytochrome bc complex cytochrome b subunit [Caldilineae bacterium]